MSLLRSYSFGTAFGQDGIPEEVLGLFLELAEHPDKKVEFASEIMFAGMCGRINFNSKFNIDAYEAAIRKNEALNKNNKRKKECAIDFLGLLEDENDTKISYGLASVDYVSNHTVKKMEDAYEQLVMEDELRYAVESIKSLQPVLMTEARIDIIHTIRQALKGVPDSVRNLQNICKEYAVLAEQVQIVLGSGYSFEEIFAQ